MALTRPSTLPTVLLTVAASHQDEGYNRKIQHSGIGQLIELDPLDNMHRHQNPDSNQSASLQRACNQLEHNGGQSGNQRADMFAFKLWH